MEKFRLPRKRKKKLSRTVGGRCAIAFYELGHLLRQLDGENIN